VVLVNFKGKFVLTVLDLNSFEWLKRALKEQVIAAIKSCEKLKPQNVTWILAALENPI